MAVYVVAQVSMADSASYERFMDRFADVAGQFDGRLLVSDPSPRVVEGDWRADKLVLIQFPDAEAFDECLESDDYRAIKAERSVDGRTLVLLVSDAA
jgi:uncharacterized protein (DUF1330 family)